MLVFDLVISLLEPHGSQSCTHVFDNRIPAIIVVDLVPIPRRINDVQLQPYSILSNDCDRQLDPL